MDIVNDTTKANMLTQLANEVNPTSGKNWFHFIDADGNKLSDIPFDDAGVEGIGTDIPYIAFTNNGSYDLEGTIDQNGRVNRFYIDQHSDVDEHIIEGTVGTPANLSADIVFNRIDWIKKNGVELSNVTITLENVCLHQ